MPACRNGRRGRLKICCGQPRMGSSPIAGIKTPDLQNSKSGVFIYRKTIYGMSMGVLEFSQILRKLNNGCKIDKSYLYRYNEIVCF